jgi:hypothetical protein
MKKLLLFFLILGFSAPMAAFPLGPGDEKKCEQVGATLKKCDGSGRYVCYKESQKTFISNECKLYATEAQKYNDDASDKSREEWRKNNCAADDRITTTDGTRLCTEKKQAAKAEEDYDKETNDIISEKFGSPNLNAPLAVRNLITGNCPSDASGTFPGCVCSDSNKEYMPGERGASPGTCVCKSEFDTKNGQCVDKAKDSNDDGGSAETKEEREGKIAQAKCKADGKGTDVKKVEGLWVCAETEKEKTKQDECKKEGKEAKKNALGVWTCAETEADKNEREKAKAADKSLKAFYDDVESAKKEYEKTMKKLIELAKK